MLVLHHGQEILLFFQQFGYKGLIGIFISNMVTAYIIYKTLEITKENYIQTYKQFLHKIIGSNKHINKIINLIVNAFLLITFYIMIAGFGAYFLQELKIPMILGATLGAFVCYMIFNKNINGIVKVNEILVPVIIILIIALGGVYANKASLFTIENETQWGKPFLYSIIYASYNSITLIPMLLSLRNFSQTKKDSIKIAILCGGILTILGIIIFLLLCTDLLINIEIPLVYIASKLGEVFKYLYGGVIIIAIVTSAIAAGYGFIQNTTNNSKEYKYINAFICITSIFISQIGFSNLVNILYPLFGYLGLMQILAIAKYKKTKYSKN